MAFEEQRAWIGGIIAVVSYGAYLAVLFVRSRDVPLDEVAYAWPLAIFIGAGVVAMIVAHAVIGLRARDEAGQLDERDREIDRFAKVVSQAFLVIASLAALLMAVAEWDQFWIANAIVLGFFTSAMAESVAKVAAYHRDFQAW